MLLKHSNEGLIIHIPGETLFATTAAAISKANPSSCSHLAEPEAIIELWSS